MMMVSFRTIVKLVALLTKVYFSWSCILNFNLERWVIKCILAHNSYRIQISLSSIGSLCTYKIRTCSLFQNQASTAQCSLSPLQFLDFTLFKMFLSFSTLGIDKKLPWPCVDKVDNMIIYLACAYLLIQIQMIRVCRQGGHHHVRHYCVFRWNCKTIMDPGFIIRI